MSDSQVKSESSETQTLQERLCCLQELTDFTANCQKQLDELFETLGWKQDFDKGSAQEPMEVCPYDPNHRVPNRTMERHKVACLLRKMGYSQEEQAEMVDPSVFYEKANISCFTMDRQTQQQVILQARASALPLKTDRLYSQGEYSRDPPDVPQNHKRAICDLTVADRLALYDHVTREARQERGQAGASGNEDLYVDLVAKLKKGEDQNGPKSHLELMAEMRDYKRRRQSYRAKNVHITKKSYTEVIREVIDVHSSELARQWRDEREEELGETKRPHRRGAEDRRSPSAESRHSHVSSRDGHASHHHRRRRSGERSRERGREPSQERTREKEGKKKRKRDSRSPDERNHEKKKKKKKKKDGKEKEKEAKKEKKGEGKTEEEKTDEQET